VFLKWTSSRARAGTLAKPRLPRIIGVSPPTCRQEATCRASESCRLCGPLGGGVFHHGGADFHPVKIGPGEERIETTESLIIVSPYGPDAAFQPAQPAKGKFDWLPSGWNLRSQTSQTPPYQPRPWLFCSQQVEQGTGVEQRHHQARSFARSASISALLRLPGIGGCCTNHSRAERPLDWSVAVGAGSAPR